MTRKSRNYADRSVYFRDFRVIPCPTGYRNYAHISIRSGVPSDHGNFVVSTAKQQSAQRHKDHEEFAKDARFLISFGEL
jgi:hypothetical protein